MTAGRLLPLILCGAAMLVMHRLVVAATPDADVVVLPPFVVEEPALTPPWRHAQTGRFEILSCCPDELTRKLAHTVSRAYDLVELFVPARFLARSDVPDALIFYNEYYWPSASRKAIAAKLRSGLPFDIPGIAPSAPRGEATLAATVARRTTRLDPLTQGGPLFWDGPPSLRRQDFFDHLRLEDVDSMTTFILVARSGPDLGGWHLSSGSVRGLLERHVPALPPWFVNGFIGLYSEAEFGGYQITLPPFIWVSREVTDETIRGTKTERLVVPLAEFFREATSDTVPIDPAARLAQAGLFVRWALTPEQPARNEAFWKLIERACTEPVGEAMFVECFGADFAEVEMQLAEYLPTAVRRPVRYIRPVAKEVALPDLRAASPAEIARIRGDWERLEARYVRGQVPALESSYYELARRTLSHDDESVQRDPGVQAVWGLLEYDAQNFAEAESHLREATRQGVVRPRAYVELARLRLEELRGTSPHPGRKIRRQDAQEVHDLLHAARKQTPALPSVYRLFAELGTNCLEGATEQDLAILDQGAALFPRQSELLYQIAMLHASYGRAERARELIEQSLRHAVDEGLRERLAALRVQLARGS